MRAKPFVYVKATDVAVGDVLVVDAVRSAVDRRKVTSVETYKGMTRIDTSGVLGKGSFTFRPTDTVPIEEKS